MLSCGLRPTMATVQSGFFFRINGRMSATKYWTASMFGSQSMDPTKTMSLIFDAPVSTGAK